MYDPESWLCTFCVKWECFMSDRMIGICMLHDRMICEWVHILHEVNILCMWLIKYVFLLWKQTHFESHRLCVGSVKQQYYVNRTIQCIQALHYKYGEQCV